MPSRERITVVVFQILLCLIVADDSMWREVESTRVYELSCKLDVLHVGLCSSKSY